jgi:sulfur-oxidizing protein SoxA
MRAAILLLALAAGGAAAQGPARFFAPAELRPGSSFMNPDIRAMQADDFANPATLWLEKGEKLWNAKSGGDGRSCATCHGDARASMKGVSARYPVFDAAEKRLFDVESRIRQCRATRQGGAALAWESEDLVALSIYVTRQSRGMPVKAAIDGGAAPHFERGRMLYQRRIGQMNLACMHCHELNAGRRLLAETISQGHPTGWPGYRLEWQAAGTVQRRLRACYFGVRAEMPPYGASDLLDLQLYLAWRGEGLAMEAPGVRR